LENKLIWDMSSKISNWYCNTVLFVINCYRY